ncbi:hypothetical protein BAUCODRAFT_339943 [Baudoinia panamericana UAMH 10762]|uniref:Aldehyde dehydrogenase domain-containing protein n=1 Tax=Baudoinia panamericana (strain UAMH 10762) TaxID=717646 RepID=M2NK86_BAUPA|nr:uncharacterized protein BAUCODRAFT_339943 [Baudoinia panamericana UAMH 10762]EMC99525.1 hypothetical protein BAUCODRAFT_339943 [Baudoinia panamericana UAMH 10762]
MVEAFRRVRAAAIDGRAHNVYFRQIQLESLFKTIQSNVGQIRNAIKADYGHADGEIAIELNLTTKALRRDYASLEPKKLLEEEYRVAHGKNSPSARRPVGVVYIEPCAHTQFFSVIVPLSAAIASGNCVIILLENNLRAVTSILRKILPKALDQDIFTIADSPVKDQELLDASVLVNEQSSERWPRANQLSSPRMRRTVAVVDRTANVQRAARELTAARFSFGGRSPYAPDIVLVNEFVKDSFLDAVLMEYPELGRDTFMNGNASSKPAISAKALEWMREKDSGIRIIREGARHALAELTPRSSPNLLRKFEGPVMLIHAVTSLDDAIDLVNSITPNEPILAGYYFANASTVKYLDQFVDSTLSLINHVPTELLVGPAYPATHAIDLAVRYPQELFTVGKPAFVGASKPTPLLAALASSSDEAARKLLAEATAPLALIKRHPGGGVGFFEQGFLLNAGLILGTTLSLSGVGLYYGMKYGRRFW